MMMQMRKYLSSMVGGRGLSTEVSIVGCGSPGRGMGWYHAKQILDGDVPSASLTDIVEPWYLGAGAGTAGCAEFLAFKTTAEAAGVRFHAKVTDLPKPASTRLTVVSSRTGDMPGIVGDLLKGKLCSHIFLEKPGAPSVDLLQKMASDAEEAGVPIFMGFNKNVTYYVTKALEAHAKLKDGEFTLVHHNSYTRETLDECFERNAEGILKNMAIHELALLVTYFGVTTETLASVKADKTYSSCETRTGPSSKKQFTDFSKVGFALTTKSGGRYRVFADRCGQDEEGGAMADGAMMYASVEKEGIVHCRAVCPDDNLNEAFKQREAKMPGTLSYFLLQHDDYITLKERVCHSIAAGATTKPAGVADIHVAIETLKLAEHLKVELEKQLK